VTGICPVQPSGARQARGGEALEEAKRCRPNARSGHYGSAAGEQAQTVVSMSGTPRDFK
jgi:hypothetical protein